MYLDYPAEARGIAWVVNDDQKMNAWSAADKLLLTCARQDFRPENLAAAIAICRHGDVDWQAAFTTATEHRVAPLIYSNLKKCVYHDDAIIPRGIMQDFKIVAAHNTIREEIREKALVSTLTYFKQQGIDVMLIKGIVLNFLVYEQPWYTTPKDIDLIIRPPSSAINSAQRKIIAGYRESGIECDSFSHHDLTMNNILPVDFQCIWRDAEKITYHDFDVYVMTPEDMLISLCINSCRKRFFHLRTMCDIAETINKFPKLDWALVTEKVRHYDVASIVYTALWVTQRYLGCRLPAQALTDLNVNPMQASLVRTLGKRMTLSDSSDLRSGHVHGVTIFGRRWSRSVVLRYVTLRRYQAWANLRFVLRTRRGEFEFWDGA